MCELLSGKAEHLDRQNFTVESPLYLCRLNQSYQCFPQNILSSFKVQVVMEIIIESRTESKAFLKKSVDM